MSGTIAGAAREAARQLPKEEEGCDLAEGDIGIPNLPVDNGRVDGWPRHRPSAGGHRRPLRQFSSRAN